MSDYLSISISNKQLTSRIAVKDLLSSISIDVQSFEIQTFPSGFCDFLSLVIEKQNPATPIETNHDVKLSIAIEVVPYRISRAWAMLPR